MGFLHQPGDPAAVVDLVAGADGLRSNVRRTVFGPHEDYMTRWDAMICAFQLQEAGAVLRAGGQFTGSRNRRLAKARAAKGSTS